MHCTGGVCIPACTGQGSVCIPACTGQGCVCIPACTGQGVSAQGMSTQGGCLHRFVCQGLSARGVWQIPLPQNQRQTLPLPCELNDRQVYKNYLAAISLRVVINVNLRTYRKKCLCLALPSIKSYLHKKT